jgi:hypothetical protein
VTDLYERLLAAHDRESEAHAARAESERQRADHVAGLAVTIIKSRGEWHVLHPLPLAGISDVVLGDGGVGVGQGGSTWQHT